MRYHFSILGLNRCGQPRNSERVVPPSQMVACTMGNWKFAESPRHSAKATKPSTKGFAMSRSRQKSTSKKPLCWGSFVRHSTNVYRVRFGPRQNCHVCCVPHLTLNKIAIRKKLKITRKKWGGPHRPAIRLFSREMNSMSHATWPARPVTHEQYAGQQYRGSGLVVTK